MSREAWTALLDRFESDLETDGEFAPWHPIAEPMPADLEDRARGLLLRQQERIAEIRAQQDAVVHQLVALRRVPAPDDVPVYIDVAG